LQTTQVPEEQVNGARVLRPVWTHRDALEALSTPGTSEQGFRRVSQEDQPGGSWFGGGLAESIRVMRDGWTEEVGRLVISPVLRSSEVSRPVKRRGVSGGLVDMGRFMAGRQDCMVQKVHGVNQRPLVRIGVDKTANWNVDIDLIAQCGRTVHTVVASLRARGFPTEVWACDAGYATGGGARGVGRTVLDARVLIQAANAPVHGARLAYWLAHPSVLRRAFFALYESMSREVVNLFGFYEGASGSYGAAVPGFAKADFSEWAPSPQEGVEATTKWAASVLGRRS
jgi:hypothetical protein